MDWQGDPELKKLFKDEIDERSRSLVEGADAMLEGEITAELSGRMVRDGHTIKGTGRVMGFEGIARGGELCESVWRLIQLGDLPTSSMLARTLLLLAETFPEALAGDDSAIADAIETVRAAIKDPDLLARLPEPFVTPASSPSPEPPTTNSELKSEPAIETHDGAPSAPGREPEAVSELHVDIEPLVFEPGPDGRLDTPSITYDVADAPMAQVATPVEADVAPSAREPIDPLALDEPPIPMLIAKERSVLDPDTKQAYDLGGLIGAVETWATEESVPVNAGRLFRMINDVAAVRIDLESVIRQASQILSSVQTGATTAAAEDVLESLEAVRRASVRLESAALRLTVVPTSSVTSTLPQLVKYLSKKMGRDVEVVVEGEDTMIDRQILDRFGELVRQIVINAVTHGLEQGDVRVAAGKDPRGTVRVSVSRDDQYLRLVISDDGAGIDWNAVSDRALDAGLVEGDPTADELRSVLFTDGFSTNPSSSEFTGSGSGLGRVSEIVEEVFGAMTFDSARGRGTSFVITMPAHRALQHAQMFTAGGRTWGIPATALVETLPIPGVSILVQEKGSSIRYKDATVPYTSFASVAGLEVAGLEVAGSPSQVMIIQSPTGLLALAVEEVLETREVATKDLGPLLSGTSVVSGVALLGGGDMVMLVDAGRLAENMRSAETQSVGPIYRILVVDDSQGARQVVSGVLASHGFSTVSAGSVADALATLARKDVDALVVDFSMPRADGVALIHMVRQRYGETPIVMLSGVASQEDRARAERAGVDAFFDKADFAKGALVEKLREIISDKANGENDSGESVTTR